MPVSNQNNLILQVEVVCKFNPTPVWLNYDPSFRFDKNRITSYLLDSRDFGLSEKGMSLLDESEKDRAGRFHKPEDRHRYTVSKIVLRQLLGLYMDRTPESIIFREGTNKKPFAEGAEGLLYNVSHSGTQTLITIFNDVIGCDIEEVKPNPGYAEIMNSVFGSEEIHFVNEVRAPFTRFYTLWTRKEALTKGTSKGIDNDFNMITCLDGINIIDSSLIGSSDNWAVETFPAPDNFICSIAHRSSWGEVPLLVRLKSTFMD